LIAVEAPRAGMMGEGGRSRRRRRVEFSPICQQKQ
jgi:hypothetical protein